MQQRQVDFFVEGGDVASLAQPRVVMPSAEPSESSIPTVVKEDSDRISIMAPDESKMNLVPYEIHSPRFFPPKTSTLPRYMIGQVEFFKVGKLYVATQDLWPLGIKRVKGVSITEGRAYFSVDSAPLVAFEQGLAVPTENQWKYIIREIYQGAPPDWGWKIWKYFTSRNYHVAPPDPTDWGWNMESNLQKQLDLDLAGGAMGSFNEYVVEMGMRGVYPCAHTKSFPWSLLYFLISETNMDIVEIFTGRKHRGPGYGLTSKSYTYRCIASKERLYRFKPVPV